LTANLGSRAFHVPLALIDGAGMLVMKSELIDRGWPGHAVEENNVQVQIHALRCALGRDRDLIQTVAGRGYRFALLRAGTPSAATLHHRAAVPLRSTTSSMASPKV
jgi:DNA-binding winged helix-turn-helix (wHTH) protein